MSKCLIGVPETDDLVDLYDIPNQLINPLRIMQTLENINRFNGRGYLQINVLQHSFFVARLLTCIGCPRSIILGGLCHDFAEAFLGDLIHPIKEKCPEFKRIEDAVMLQMMGAINMGDVHNVEVKRADLIALNIEARYCGFSTENWNLPPWVFYHGLSVDEMELSLEDALNVDLDKYWRYLSA